MKCSCKSDRARTLCPNHVLVNVDKDGRPRFVKAGKDLRRKQARPAHLSGYGVPSGHQSYFENHEVDWTPTVLNLNLKECRQWHGSRARVARYRFLSSAQRVLTGARAIEPPSSKIDTWAGRHHK